MAVEAAQTAEKERDEAVMRADKSTRSREERLQQLEKHATMAEALKAKVSSHVVLLPRVLRLFYISQT